MLSIAIRRLHAVPLHKGTTDTRRRLAWLTELAGLGYRVQDTSLLADTAIPDHVALLGALQSLRGGDVTYVPLFLRFPDEVPDDGAYFARRIVGFLGTAYGVFDGTHLETSVVVPPWLFDLEAFGADPLTQMQTREQFEAAQREAAGRAKGSNIHWIDLELIEAAELHDRLLAWARTRLYAASSIKAGERADVVTILEQCGTRDLDPTRIVQKEHLALVLKLAWLAGDREVVEALVRTPTDLLRLFAALTDTDVGLCDGVKLPKLTRPQRRLVIRCLDRAPALEEDLYRYRGLWKTAARHLHPREHRRAHPRVSEAFDALHAGTLTTYQSTLERLLGGHRITPVLKHLRKRPGIFARRLHEVLRGYPKHTHSILTTFESVASQLPMKTLLVLHATLQHLDQSEERAIIIRTGKIQVLPNPHQGVLGVATTTLALETFERLMARQLGHRPSWKGKTVYIDPALIDYTVPLQQRAASEGLISVGRGSRMPMDPGAVIRLFVWWQQAKARTDLDLSLLQLDENFERVGHVSYTQLAASGLQHSGDLQSAEHGAAEFIDVDLASLSWETRYLAMVVLRYAGDRFADMSCHAGWMMRDALDARYETFDPATVRHAFDLHGAAAYAIPLLIDVERRQAISVDLYLSGKALHNRIEGAGDTVARTCRAIASFPRTRPNLATLARLHVEARLGELTEDPGEADIRFSTCNATYSPFDVGSVLTDLL